MQTGLQRWRTSCLILSSLSLLLAACSGETPVPPATPTSGSDGFARIEGTVVAESDVSGQPDEPLADQLVVAVPRAVLQDLAGPDQPLRFTSVHLKALPEGTVTAVTDAAGHYRLRLAPGEYALCLAYPEATSDAERPLLIRGCGALTAAAGSERTVDISSGFGEIRLVEP